MNEHAQQVVDPVELKQSEIIRNTGQRKNPIVQQKINEVSKQKRRTRSRASTSDKLAEVLSVVQSPDPHDSAEYEAWIRQRSDRQRSTRSTNFDKHVEILEEQYIDKEIDVAVMLQKKVPTTQTVHREQWRCIRCSLSTQLTTFL